MTRNFTISNIWSVPTTQDWPPCTFRALGHCWPKSPNFRGQVNLSWGGGSRLTWGGVQLTTGPSSRGGGMGAVDLPWENIVACTPCTLCDPPFRRGDLWMEKRIHKTSCRKVVMSKIQNLLLVNNPNIVVLVYQRGEFNGKANT